MGIADEVFELIKGIPLNAVLREKLTTLTDMVNKLEKDIAAKGKQIDRLTADITAKKKSAFDLSRDNARLKGQIIALQSQVHQLSIDNQELQIKTKPINPMAYCPYCGERAGNLDKIVPHKTFGIMGVNTHLFTCSNCGKAFSEEKKTL